MKERLEELYEQSMVPTYHGENFYTKEFNPYMFANLIIQECIQVVESQERKPPELWFTKPAKVHAQAIRDHFGIDWC